MDTGGDGPLLRRFPKGKKIPSGATPEGQIREYDQAPLGVLIKTATTETATAEARSKR